MDPEVSASLPKQRSRVARLPTSDTGADRGSTPPPHLQSPECVPGVHRGCPERAEPGRLPSGIGGVSRRERTGGGYEVHLFSHVLHDSGEEQVRQLFAASFAALPPRGWIVDHDTHINPKDQPLPVAEYSGLLMHSTPGKCWSVAELTEFLEQTGFTDVAWRPTAADRTAVLARRPG